MATTPTGTTTMMIIMITSKPLTTAMMTAMFKVVINMLGIMKILTLELLLLPIMPMMLTVNMVKKAVVIVVLETMLTMMMYNDDVDCNDDLVDNDDDFGYMACFRNFGIKFSQTQNVYISNIRFYLVHKNSTYRWTVLSLFL